MLSLTHGACFGVRSTVYTVLGGAVGFFLVIAASLAGMGALLAASERAFTIAKWIGAAYRLSRVRVWRAPALSFRWPRGTRVGRGEAAPDVQSGASSWRCPTKALIFFTAFLHSSWSRAFLAVQLAALGGTFVVVEIVYELLLAAMAQRIAPWLARHGRWFNRAAGTTFVGIGAALTTASR